MTYAIPMQPRGFRRLRRLVWTIRCFFAYRAKNREDWRNLENSLCWHLAKCAAESEADSNDANGWAWGSPADAVEEELGSWTDDEGGAA